MFVSVCVVEEGPIMVLVKLFMLLCLCTILLKCSYPQPVDKLSTSPHCRHEFVFDVVKQLICEADQAAMMIYSQRERSGKAYKGN